MISTSTIGSVWYLKFLSTALTADLFALPLFAVPISFLIWSFNKWASYNQTNSDRNARIQDALDKKTYKEIIIPLYDAIAANLVENAYSQITDITVGVSTKDFLSDYENKKSLLLKKTDYKALEEIIKFQDALENIIKEKKNKFVLKACSGQNKQLMLAIAITSFIQIIVGIIILTIRNSQYFYLGIYAWAILLVLILVFGARYGFNENTIDNL